MKRGKKWGSMLLGVVCLFQINILSVRAESYWPEEPEIIGDVAVVMEASTGTVLYEKNAHKQQYPASITKIMTALLALENSALDETVVFTAEAVYETEGSSIARDVDEVMTMEQCLYALMLESANECAYAIAEHIGGDYDTFINMMNDRAMELGCKNTHFNNPHGLPDENHLTSAYDMALISKEALKNEEFRLICSTKKYTIPPTNKHEKETYLKNNHQMLNPYKETKYLYDGCIGGKTGYTDTAHNTLVTFAQRDGMTLICVVLNEQKSNQYEDTTTLLNYCFENFQLWNIAENEKKYPSCIDENSKDTLSLDKNGFIVLPKTAVFEDAVAKVIENEKSERKYASLKYVYAEREVGRTDILKKDSGKKEVETAKKQKSKKPNLKIAIIGIAVVMVFIFARDRMYCFLKKILYKGKRIYRKQYSKIRKIRQRYKKDRRHRNKKRRRKK